MGMTMQDSVTPDYVNEVMDHYRLNLSPQHDKTAFVSWIVNSGAIRPDDVLSFLMSEHRNRKVGKGMSLGMMQRLYSCITWFEQEKIKIEATCRLKDALINFRETMGENEVSIGKRQQLLACIGI